MLSQVILNTQIVPRIFEFWLHYVFSKTNSARLCHILLNMSSPMNVTLLLLLCHCHTLTMVEGPYSHSERHSRYAKRFIKSLSKRQRRIRRRYIPRPSLHLPDALSWRQMYKACQDQALITMTGLDFATFDWLSDKFAVLFDMHSPWNQTTRDIVTLQLQTRGRKHSITA